MTCGIPGQRKAIGITSGGLDSILSALVLKDQGIEVTWVGFETPFFSSEAALKAAENLDIPIIIRDITDRYLEMLKAPPAGYGRNMNPCMDCHALMFELAGLEMDQQGASFLFSGEVAGQRPKSQNKNSMRYVEKNSGFDGYILRPLSAKLLPETVPEKSGMVDRERLLGISGRSRSEQMSLAEKFGVTDYPSPAGGCLLTDVNFSRRLRDLMFVQKEFEKRELHLLKHGRHFRLDDRHKAVVGKTEADNNAILEYYDSTSDVLIRHGSRPGPVVLVPGRAGGDVVEKGAYLCAAYTKKIRRDVPADIMLATPSGRETIHVTPMSEGEFGSFKEQAMIR
ncbi:MAG: tRNA 4-thiouridine(8) synthase ThiI [Desulfobacteraceae bacterium]